MTKTTASIKGLEQRAAAIRLVALDMDGTLTDGSINMGVEGELFKRFSCRDGLAISAARRHGLRIAVITGRMGPVILRRAQELGIEKNIMAGVSAKGRALRQLAADQELPLSAVAFMGDDLNDLPALQIAGLSAAPVDAAEDVKRRVDFLAPHPGGEGAVRDLLELILKAQGLWDVILSEYCAEGREDRQ